MAHRKRIGKIGTPPHRWKKHRRSRREAFGTEVDITKFKVVVIESLQENELHTGHNLYERELVPISKADDSFVPLYYSVTTVCEFEGVIKDVCKKLRANELVTLHIEAHGDEEKGICLASHETLKWKDFLDMCRTINEKINGLLVVTLALCYSIPVLGDIDPSKRAPFKTVLYTRRDVSFGEIEDGFRAYYRKYRNILDFFKATGAIRAEVNDGDEITSPYDYMVADDIFDKIVDPDRDPDGFKHIVNENYCMMKARNPKYTREQTEKEIRGFLADLAKNGKGNFLFWDKLKKGEGG